MESASPAAREETKRVVAAPEGGHRRLWYRWPLGGEGPVQRNSSFAAVGRNLQSRHRAQEGRLGSFRRRVDRQHRCRYCIRRRHRGGADGRSRAGRRAYPARIAGRKVRRHGEQAVAFDPWRRAACAGSTSEARVAVRSLGCRRYSHRSRGPRGARRRSPASHRGHLEWDL